LQIAIHSTRKYQLVAGLFSITVSLASWGCIMVRYSFITLEFGVLFPTRNSCTHLYAKLWYLVWTHGLYIDNTGEGCVSFWRLLDLTSIVAFQVALLVFTPSFQRWRQTTTLELKQARLVQACRKSRTAPSKPNRGIAFVVIVNFG